MITTPLRGEEDVIRVRHRYLLCMLIFLCQDYWIIRAQKTDHQRPTKKEAKRYRAASTTPRSISGTLPHEYDMLMGIVPVEPQESERFEEGNNSDFHGTEDADAHSREPNDQPPNDKSRLNTELLAAGELHGGYGSISWEECLERIIPPESTTCATHHSGEGSGTSTSSMTNPPRVSLSQLFVCQSKLTEFFAELTEFAVKLSEAQFGHFSRGSSSQG